MLTAEQHQYADAFDLQEDYFARGWTDGLPIVPPTPALVERFLSFAGLAPDTVVGVLDQREVTVTAEHVAINAVMAGCRAEYLPVVVAAVKALLQPEGHAHIVTATTNNPAQVLVVNGPVRDEIGLNCGQSCFGPGFRPNATIGRALRLVVRNVFGSVPGTIDQSVFSTPSRYSFCFGEDEASVPWRPLHVERGFAAEQSTVTVFSAMPFLMAATAASTDPSDVVDVFVDRLYHSHHSGWLWGDTGASLDVLVVIGAEHARYFVNGGWSKDDIRAAMWERMAARPGRPGTRFEGMPLLLQPEDILLVAAGGAGNPLSALFTPLGCQATTAVV